MGFWACLPLTRGVFFSTTPPVNALDPAERHRLATILTQDFGRYELTVRQNLLMGISGRSATDEQLWDALEKARAPSSCAPYLPV